jgi:hypothetical protein
MKSLLMPALVLALFCNPVFATDASLATRDAAWNALRQAGNVEGLDELVDNSFVLVHSDGRVQYKTDYLAELRERKRVNGEIRNEGVSYRQYGDTAIVNGTSVQSAVTDGKPWSGKFRFTRVWRMDGKVWKLVSSHSSRIPD